MNAEQQRHLRTPFPKESIGQLPRAGMKFDYVGHAAVTDRLLQVDPEWTWEPFAFTDTGLPYINKRGNDAILWVRLTICGVTRPGVGIVKADSFDCEKQLIGDAIRNAAMRFGVALDLWSREELGGATPPAADETDTQPVSKNQVVGLQERVTVLQADGVKFNDLRREHELPLLRHPIDPSQFRRWKDLIETEEAKRHLGAVVSPYSGGEPTSTVQVTSDVV